MEESDKLPTEGVHPLVRWREAEQLLGWLLEAEIHSYAEFQEDWFYFWWKMGEHLWSKYAGTKDVGQGWGCVGHLHKYKDAGRKQHIKQIKTTIFQGHLTSNEVKDVEDGFELDVTPSKLRKMLNDVHW
jgi:uncharacterized protein YnzC (UPF0291/DUF896 family)